MTENLSDKELQKWWEKLSIEWKDLLAITYKSYSLGQTNVEDAIFPTNNDLRKIIALKSLNLGVFSKVDDLNLLKYFFNLEELRLVKIKGTTDLKIINQLTKLSKLELSSVPIESIEEVSSLSNLEELTISSAKIDNIQPLSTLKKLKILSLRYNLLLKDFTPLQNLQNLVELNCTNSYIDDLQVLEKLETLTTLRVSETNITSLNPLEKLINLETLEFFDTEVNNLKPISNCLKLKRLVLFETQVNNLKDIEKLQNLEYLDVAGCYKLTSLEGIERFHKLEYLDIGHTPIKELKPLFQLENLGLLFNENTSLLESDVEELKKINEHIFIKYS